MAAELMLDGDSDRAIYVPLIVLTTSALGIIAALAAKEGKGKEPHLTTTSSLITIQGLREDQFMPTRATLAVLPMGSRTLKLEDALLQPRPHEVVVKQTASGVCHSQLDQIEKSTRFGAPAANQPVIMGHESVGTIVDIGSDVTEFRVGERVLVTWVPRTRSLDRLPLPSEVTLLNGDVAVTHNVFAWGTHTVVDELYVCRAPDGTPDDVGAVVGCAVMTGAGAVTNTAAVQPGDSAVVWGCGGVGLSAIAAAVVSGASPVIAVDVDNAKLAKAKQFGAHHCVNVRTEDPVARIHELTKTRYTSGADYVFDCIAKPETIRSALASARSSHITRTPGGSVVVVGVPTQDVAFEGLDLVANEKRLIGCKGGNSVPEVDFERLVGWHTKGLLDLETLVTARYRLDQINEAVDDLREGKIVGRAILVL